MSEPQDGFGVLVRAAGWMTEHWEQVLQHPIVASALGSLFAAWHAFPGATTAAKAVNGVSCFLIGVYAGPAINDAWGTESKRVAAGVVIACSVGGLVVVNGALDYLRRTPFADLMAKVPLVGKLFERNKEQP